MHSLKPTEQIKQQVYKDNLEKYGVLTCYLCNKPIIYADSSIDHIHPVSRGGKNNLGNLAIAHQQCNDRKFDRTIDELLDMNITFEYKVGSLLTNKGKFRDTKATYRNTKLRSDMLA